MKQCCIILCLIALFTCLKAQENAQSIDAYLSASRPRNTFNGTALVVHKGTVLLYKGYGYKNLKANTPNDSLTIFRLGSLSKPFTASVIMELEQEGPLKLSDPLSHYLTDYPAGNDITIEELLTHSSGIKEYLQVKAIQRLSDNAAPIDMDSLISLFKNEPRSQPPGKQFSYSNSNYILLARIVEKVTNRKFEQFVRERIFTPLQMSHSGFDFRHLEDANKATGYSTKVIKSAFTTHQWLYGYGWFVYNLYGRRCVSHAGGVPGFQSNLQFFPDDDLCIILLSNRDGGDMVELSDHIASFVFGLPYKSSGL